MPIYQILASGLAAVMGLFHLSRLARGQESFRNFLAALVIWSTIASAALYPEWTRYLAQVTGIRSNVNAVVFTALIIIFYLLLKIILRQEQFEQDLTKIVRQEALKAVSKKK